MSGSIGRIRSILITASVTRRKDARVVDSSLRPLLDRFEAAVLADPSVLGVLYTGSLGRGTADRFSDLDLDVWLGDAAFAELPTKTRDLLAVLGPVGWSMDVAPGWTH